MQSSAAPSCLSIPATPLVSRCVLTMMSPVGMFSRSLLTILFALSSSATSSGVGFLFWKVSSGARPPAFAFAPPAITLVSQNLNTRRRVTSILHAQRTRHER